MQDLPVVLDMCLAFGFVENLHTDAPRLCGPPMAAKLLLLKLFGIRGAQVLALTLRSGCDHQADDEAVQAQGLGEDEDQDHADEEARLLRIRPHASIANDADGEASGQGGHANSEAGGQMGIAGVGRVSRGLHLAVDDHRRDEAVDAKDPSHDNGDDRAHHHVRPHDAHRRDANAGFRSAVGRAKVREDNGRGHAHEAEEGGGGIARLHLEWVAVR
eukprot:CAMPEP_0183599652 /NCGR_PEP_ID=MMETSP0371-20130417/179541_1 /TAXON_ID=268820 /ORGANISM="Peridinium aciculiferum, Strain PAER-2" /LENGTH=215 /DNA_ID=CAMNT_0025811721 /DNA_START=140 /DNA_END=788 /DNA_ORIENTATION=-